MAPPVRVTVASVTPPAAGGRIWVERRRPDVPCGRVVLCAPGGRNAAYWPPAVLEALAAAGLEVIRFDWPGQGRSSGPAPIDPEAIAAAVAAVLHWAAELDGSGSRNAPVLPLDVVGVGLGGWAAATALRRSAACPPPSLPSTAAGPARHLVLIGCSAWYADPALPGPDEPTVVALVLRRRGHATADRHRALRREVRVERNERRSRTTSAGTAADRTGTADGQTSTTADRTGAAPGQRAAGDPAPSPELESPEIDGTGGIGRIDGRDAIVVELDAAVAAWLDHGLVDDDHRALWLAADPIPAEVRRAAAVRTVLHGAHDPVVPVVHGRRLAEHVDGRFEVVDGCGHHLDAAMQRALLDALLDLR